MQYEKIDNEVSKIIEPLRPNLAEGQFANSTPSDGISSDNELKQSDNISSISRGYSIS